MSGFQGFGVLDSFWGFSGAKCCVVGLSIYICLGSIVFDFQVVDCML